MAGQPLIRDNIELVHLREAKGQQCTMVFSSEITQTVNRSSRGGLVEGFFQKNCKHKLFDCNSGSCVIH